MSKTDINKLTVVSVTPCPPDGGSCRLAVSVDDGEVFISPSISGMSDAEAVLCCGYDGEPVHMIKGSAFVRTEWLKSERPELADDIDRLSGIAKGHGASAKAKKELSK